MRLWYCTSGKDRKGKGSAERLGFSLTMKSINGTFYNSIAWKRCRAEYLRLNPFCEECLKEFRFTPATHVHHKIFLNAKNVNDPAISLNPDNLEAVCLDCHNKIHFKQGKRRYIVGEGGKILPRSDE